MDDSKLTTWNQRKLFVLAALIGVLTGFAAWGFRLLIGVIHNCAFLGVFSASYDANLHTPESSWGWLIVFVPVLGGIIVVWLIQNFAPEAKGHGVPEVMSAIHHKQGRIRGIVSMVKALASAVTIGTGGSLGREGPIVQISAAMSSSISQLLKISVSQRNVLIACGASGGIAATFNAPIGGVLFSVELLLLSINSRTILPVVTSAVIAANVGRYLIGPEPAFAITSVLADSGSENPLVLLLYFPFAAIVGLVALVFIRSIYFSEDFFERLPINPYMRHIIGMLGLGCIIYTLHQLTGHYYVQGVGYATIQDILSQTLVSPGLMLALLVLKVLAVMLTIGSGGSGGVFSPSLYLGVVVGGLIGTTLAAVAPVIGADPVTFALVGMAAMVAATTSAPMTAALMTYEMTLNYHVVLPVMVGVSVAYAVRRSFSKGDIYSLKLIRRGLKLPEGFLADTTSQVIIDEVMNRDIEFVASDDVITGSENTFCVIENENVVGLVNPAPYRMGVEFKARDAMMTSFVVIHSGTTLQDLLKIISQKNYQLAVVSLAGKPLQNEIIGVFNPNHFMEIMAKSSRLHT